MDQCLNYLDLASSMCSLIDCTNNSAITALACLSTNSQSMQPANEAKHKYNHLAIHYQGGVVYLIGFKKCHLTVNAPQTPPVQNESHVCSDIYKHDP